MKPNTSGPFITTEIFHNIPFIVCIKKIGILNLWKIRGICKSRTLKVKYTIDAAKELQMLHGINVDSEIIKMLTDELKQYNVMRKQNE